MLLPESEGFIVEYLAKCRVEGLSESTIEASGAVLRSFGAWVGARRLADLEPDDLDAYFEEKRLGGAKHATRKRVMQTLRPFFRWLANRGRLLANPARDLTLERENDRELPPPPLSIQDVAALLDGLPRRSVLDIRNKAMLELMYGCGLRRSEVVDLDLKAVDLVNQTLHVIDGKWNKDRDVPIGRGALLAAKDYLALRRSLLRSPEHGAFFLDRVGRRIRRSVIQGIFDKINRWAKARGLPHVHPHLLRHSIAVHLLQNGADVRYVQQFLGHANLDTTKIYLRLVPGHLKDDYDKAFPEIAVQPV